VGSEKYEENIIVDCFGVERLEEYRGKGMLDLCLVYGAQAAVLSQAPGGRDNAKMVSKSLFHTLSLADGDGNYFIRPDRILGAFVISSSKPLFGREEAWDALEMEQAADLATKDRIDAFQRSAAAVALKLRSLHSQSERIDVKMNSEGSHLHFQSRSSDLQMASTQSSQSRIPLGTSI
jgi:hypothetical protein